MKTHFILVEDDPQQSETIKSAIKRRFRDVEVELLENESEFCNHLARIPVGREHPRAVICDVMLPYAFPSPDAPPAPPEVLKGTFRQAGLRCWERFRQREDLQSVPWIYFTVLDEKTIDLKSYSDERTGYAQKSGSIKPLLEEIEEFLDDDWPERAEDVSNKLMANPKMQKILLEGLKVPLDGCSTALP